MKLYVLKNPDPLTRSRCVEVTDDARQPEAPWELMTLPEYQDWLEQQPPITPPVQVPESVRAPQLRQWLIDHDLYSAVEQVLAGIPDTKTRLKAQQRWEYEINYRRDDPLVNQLGIALGMDMAAIDRAFVEAAVYD